MNKEQLLRLLEKMDKSKLIQLYINAFLEYEPELSAYKKLLKIKQEANEELEKENNELKEQLKKLQFKGAMLGLILFSIMLVASNLTTTVFICKGMVEKDKSFYLYAVPMALTTLASLIALIKLII